MLLKGFAPPPRQYMNKDILFKTIDEWKDGTEEFYDQDTIDEDIYDIAKKLDDEGEK